MLTLSSACAFADAQQSPAALSACSSQQAYVSATWGSAQSLVGAYVVSAREVADWQETRDAARGARPPSSYRGRPSTEPVTVCYFDGDFDHFPGKGRRPAYDRIVVLIDQKGDLTLDSAGPRAQLRVERPSLRP